MFEQQQQRRQQREVAEQTAMETGTDPFVIAAAASVVISLYSYFVQGNRELGIFVGLWPPTFLAFASHFNQLRMQQKLEYMTSGKGLMKGIEKVMGNR